MTERKDPYDLPQLNFNQVEDSAQMESESAELMRSAVARNAEKAGTSSFPVYLVVPIISAVSAIQARVAETVSVGVKIEDFESLVGDLWEVFGDERKIADSRQVRHAARAAMTRVMGKKPSFAAVTLAESMLESVVAIDDGMLAKALASGEGTRRAVKTTAEIADAFEKELDKLSAVHLNRAAAEILDVMEAAENLSVLSIVAEDPSENDVCQRMFYARGAASGFLDVSVVRKNADSVELSAELRDADARFAVSHGSHVYNALVSDVVASLLEEGAEPADIAVVAPELSDDNEVMYALAEAGIGFEATIPYALADIPIGQFFADILSRTQEKEAIMQLRRAAAPAESQSEGNAETDGIEEAEMLPSAKRKIQVVSEQLDATCSRIASSRYMEMLSDADSAYIAARLAGALAVPPENETASTPEDNADSPEADEAPQCDLAAVELIEAGDLLGLADMLEKRVLEGNWPQSPGKDEDDLCVLLHIKAFLQAVPAGSNSNLARIVDMEDFGAESVNLPRGFGDEGGRVSVALRSNALNSPAKHFVMTRMDSVSYSGYARRTPFAPLLDFMGVETEPWASRRLARTQILDIVRRAKESGGSVTFTRSANDSTGRELPAAPLFIEASRAFGSQGDDGLPETLDASRKRVLSEADSLDGLIGESASLLNEKRVQGGALDAEALKGLLDPTENEPHCFSATEVEAYWDCPRKWFLSRKAAGYDSPPAERDWDEPRSRGLAVHKTLEEYYRSYGLAHPRADLDDDREAEQAFEKAFLTGMAKAFGDKASEMSRGVWSHKTAQIKENVRNLLMADRDFLPGFEPRFFEKDISCHIAGVPMFGSIDRVDASVKQRPDGYWDAVIVDYKGYLGDGYTFHFDKDENAWNLNGHIQGLIYALLFEKAHPQYKVGGLIYRSYANGDAKATSEFPQGKRGSLEAGKFHECLEQFEQELEEAMARLAEGDVSFRPNRPSACSFCPMAATCPAKVVV